ncbi:MAG: DUF4139 domain-containing protein [Armatimonadota bacterium]|nr:MAG: DUF4139 domain-containing protein [Armatimonadota bacterium]
MLFGSDRLRLLAVLSVAAALLSASCAFCAEEPPGGVQLTIYNQDFGLVKHLRAVPLSAGRNTVVIDDVAALIQPETVHFVSLTAPDAVRILEQNYQYDLLDPVAVLNKSVGKRVVVRHPESGEVVEGTLLNPVTWDPSGPAGQAGGASRAASPASLVIQTPKGPVLNTAGQIELAELPEGLISKPRLLWLLESGRAGTHQMEISYLTRGLNWSADYVAAVSADDSSLDLQGWVTLTNNSGASYRNATLQLVAGDVRRVAAEKGRGIPEAMDMVRMAGAAPQFQEEQFFDYHLYTLQRPTDVLDRETKQVSLLETAGVKVAKKYYYDGARNQWWWRSPGWRPGEQYDTSDYRKVNVTIEIKNSKEAGLGLPLPKGVVRVYKKDSRGNQQFVGEDSIDHTPVDETIRLYVGDAFDIVGERKRVKFSRISDRVVEETFEVSLRNHQEKAVQVTVVEHVSGDWEVLESSHKWTNPDARTLNIVVDVPAKGETKVTYRVRTRW